MVTEIEANYIGCEERSFVDKKGSTVRYRKLNFLCHGEQTPFSMSVRSDVDLINVSPFDRIVLMIDWYYNVKTGFWNPRIVKVLTGDECSERLKRADIANSKVGKVVSNG